MMQMRQKPKSGIWLVDYVDDNGVRRRASTGLKDKGEAQKAAREIVLGVRATPTRPEKASTAAARVEGMTMKDVWRECQLTVWSPRECKSQRTMKSNLGILEPLLGSKLVSAVDHNTLVELQQALAARGYKPATVKRKMDMVGKSLTVAEQRGWITRRPVMPSIKVDNYKTRVLTDAEEALVFAAIDKRIEAEPQRPWTRFKHLVRWLLDTGMRLGETQLATSGWIEVRNGRAVVSVPAWATKTNKDRTVPLSKAVAESLPWLRINADGGPFFPFKHSSAWYMWTNIRDDLAKQGHDLSDVVVHTFRHTCITRLVKSGMPLNKVSLWAGHADIKITHSRYAHLEVDDLWAGADILDRRAQAKEQSAA